MYSLVDQHNSDGPQLSREIVTTWDNIFLYLMWIETIYYRRHSKWPTGTDKFSPKKRVTAQEKIPLMSDVDIKFLLSKRRYVLSQNE